MSERGTIIVRPRGLGSAEAWEVFEDEQVRPAFLSRRQAIDYAIWRGNDGGRPLEVHDAAGAILRAIDGPALKVLAEQRAQGLLTAQ